MRNVKIILDSFFKPCVVHVLCLLPLFLFYFFLITFDSFLKPGLHVCWEHLRVTRLFDTFLASIHFRSVFFSAAQLYPSHGEGINYKNQIQGEDGIRYMSMWRWMGFQICDWFPIMPFQSLFVEKIMPIFNLVPRAFPFFTKKRKALGTGLTNFISVRFWRNN